MIGHDDDNKNIKMMAKDLKSLLTWILLCDVIVAESDIPVPPKSSLIFNFLTSILHIHFFGEIKV